jgi:dTDP-4-dehydrorhamnose reductase
MRVLIFGAAGQFGSSFEDACTERSIDFFGPASSEVDVSHPADVIHAIRDFRPEVVVNSTGVVDMGKCESDPELAFSINATAVRGIATACNEAKCFLVQTSTHLVFDGTKGSAYTERDMPRPNSIYAASKLAGEYLALSLCSQAYAVRFPTLYGRRRNQAQGFVEKMVDRLRARERLRIADDRMDCPTWALHAARAVLDLVDTKADSGLFHIANAGQVNYYDFVCTLRSLLHMDTEIERAKDSDFPAIPPKPLRVAITSDKRPPLALWETALADYVTTLEV